MVKTMKYIKYSDLLDNYKVRIVEVELKPNSNMDEVEWFRHMISGMIIEVADKLEDVIEAIVVIEGRSHTCYKPRDFNKTSHRLLRMEIFDNKKTVYGGVWNEDGLDYVCKMNYKGDFEIL